MMKSQTAQTSSMSPGTSVFGRFSLKGKVFPCVIVNHKWKSRSKKWTIKFTENFGKNYGPPPRKLQEECIYPFKLFLTKEEAEAGWKEENITIKSRSGNMGDRKKKVGISYADYKKGMVLKEEYSPTEIIRIAMEYEKINKYLEDKSLDEYVLALDVKRQEEIQAEKEQKEKDKKAKDEKDKFMKEQMALLWEKNKEKLMAQFETKSVQEVMEKVEEVEEECEDCESSVEENAEKFKCDFLATKPNKTQMVEWCNENIDEPEISGLNKNQLKKYIKEY